MKVTSSLDCVKVNNYNKEVIVYKKCILIFMNYKGVILDNERIKLYCGTDIIEIHPRDKKIIINNDNNKIYEY